MCYANFPITKVLVVEKSNILKYESFSKYFKKQGVSDNVRELKFSDGNLFGSNFSNLERNYFLT